MPLSLLPHGRRAPNVANALLASLAFCRLPGTQEMSAVLEQRAAPNPKDVQELRRHDPAAAEAGTPSELTAWLFDGVRRRRSSLAKSGYSLEAHLTVDASAHPSGGADPDSSAFRGLLDAMVTVDAGQARGIEGGTFVVGVQALGGDNGSAEVGVAQSYSNIDADDDRVQLARLWYQHSWYDGWSRLRLGKMDANSLFAGVPGATRFIHSSMGFSPTILGFPSYPDPAFGAALRQRITPALSLGVGLFDGAGQAGVKTGEHGLGSLFGEPDDLFFIGEVTGQWTRDSWPGRLTLGAWEHTGDFARFGGGTEEGTNGLYVILEQRMGVVGRPMDLFLQLGEADEDVSALTRHVGLGATATDLLLTEREDALGCGVSWVEFSNAAGAGFTEDSETAIELFYSFRLMPGIRLKPDFQYVLDPGGDTALDDAWILTLRMTVTL